MVMKVEKADGVNGIVTSSVTKVHSSCNFTNIKIVLTDRLLPLSHAKELEPAPVENVGTIANFYVA